MIEILRTNLAFRRLFAGQVASLCGDWFNYIAVVTLIGDTKGGGIMAIAWLTVLKQLPVFLFSAPAGVCADKFDRKRIMFICDILRTALVLLIIPASYFGRFAVLILIGACAVVSAFFDPARTASLPQLVKPDELRSANTLGSVAWSLCMLVGAALGGLATELFGAKLALVIDSISFLASAYLIYLLPPLLPSEREYLDAEKTEKVISFTDFIFNKLTNVERIIAVLIKGIFGLGAAVNFIQSVVGLSLGFGESGAGGLSVTFMARALGAVLGMVVIKKYFDSVAEIIIVTIGLIICGLSYFTVGITQGALTFLFAMFCAHFGSALVWVYSTIWIQRLFPNEERGRAAGLDIGLFMLTSCVVTILCGKLVSGDYLTAREVAEMCGAFWVLMGLVLMPFRRIIINNAKP